MPNDTRKNVQIEYTIQFERDMRRLSKKYRRIKSDVKPVIKKLEVGEALGTQVQRTGQHIVFKVRIKNSDIKKGKRAGYRMLYYVQTAETIILLTIYSKTEQGDISFQNLLQIIAEYEE